MVSCLYHDLELLQFFVDHLNQSRTVRLYLSRGTVLPFLVLSCLRNINAKVVRCAYKGVRLLVLKSYEITGQDRCGNA